MEKPLGYTLKAENLKKIMYKDSSAVKDWHSTLTITKDGKDLVKKEIEVNDPLFFEGRRFYQSGWQEGYKLNIKVLEKATGSIEEFPIEVGINYYNVEGIDKTYSFGGGKAFFRLDRFYPHFIMSGKQFSSRSANLVNPGAVIQVYWPGLKDAKRKILFSRFADMDFGRMHNREEKKGEEPFKFTLDKKIGTSYITGLEVGEDPGTDVVYAGFLFMILGVFVGFYFYHQSIWIGVKRKGSKMELVIAGMATRNKYQFERKFEKLVSGFSLYLTEELKIDKNKIKIENSKQEG
jgi:cytochrome c biogenesis protein